MQKNKVFLKLLLVGVVILGVGVFNYFKAESTTKSSNVECLKYEQSNSNTTWGQGFKVNGLETCRYKDFK
ncbi:MAG: hypothetical protein ACRC28_15825 [Clostridium sp.]|uniref:hypothetical protein n=1 Tax=Clostridium sp. TaxID=1506 RepID=UPI003F305A93